MILFVWNRFRYLALRTELDPRKRSHIVLEPRTVFLRRRRRTAGHGETSRPQGLNNALSSQDCIRPHARASIALDPDLVHLDLVAGRKGCNSP